MERGGAQVARGLACIAVVLTTIALVACAGEGTQSPAPSIARSPQAVASATPTVVPVPEATVVEVPEASERGRETAIAAATATAAAFARPNLGYEEWIAGIYPHLSQSGALAYQDTDPARIPATQVTGPGEVLPASTDVALVVRLPTDAGAYDVSLTRTGPDAPWLADRIRPAQG